MNAGDVDGVSLPPCAECGNESECEVRVSGDGGVRTLFYCVPCITTAINDLAAAEEVAP